jgi:hypothetical protein
VSWGSTPTATFSGLTQLPVAEFDSIYPCAGRQCIPQPDTDVGLDILSYRQRPTWRLAYRNFGTHRSLVTSQSVEARPGIAGMRWYELRRPGNQPIVYQQGTYAPADDLNRWMGSIAQDKKGNMAPGLQRVQRDDLPGHPLHGPAPQRRPQPDAAGRGHDHRGLRLPDRPGRPLGRLHLHEHPPGRQLPLLVRQPGPRGDVTEELADPIAAFRLPGCNA